MVCIIGEDCDTVVHSEYSRFLAIPIELLGMVYYAFISISYGLTIVLPNIFNIQAVFWVLSATIGAFLFSAYLVFIQGLVLREWCEWCLTSAFICLGIFLSAIFGVPVGLVDFLAGNHLSISIIFGLATAIGLGSSTVTNVLFLKFLKDLRISSDESAVLKIVSQVTWFALGLLVISGAGIFLPQAEKWLSSSVFLLMSVVLVIIILVEAVLYLKVAPRLMRVSFGEEHEHMKGELHYARRMAFILSATAIVSWYAFFVLKSIGALPFDFKTILIAYIIILIISVLLGIFTEKSLSRGS